LNKELSNILAVIHGDGGHYEDEHGIEKATKDAIEKFYSKCNEIEELKYFFNDFVSELYEELDGLRLQCIFGYFASDLDQFGIFNPYFREDVSNA